MFLSATLPNSLFKDNSCLKMMYPGDPRATNMEAENIFSPGDRIVFTMDAKHVLKRLRNNVLSSGDSDKCTRKLVWNNIQIIWKYWIEAYLWDVSCNPEMMRIHHRLTKEHIYVTAPGKMRNHLAEQCIIMLNMMKLYQKSLEDQGRDSKYLDGSVYFLEHTSKMVSVFNNNRPIIEMDYEWLIKSKELNDWFAQWDNGTSHNKELMSHETREDVAFCTVGFISICLLGIADGYSVLPSRVNSDVENFCQQRGSPGDNNNPTYLQYCKNINTIVMKTGGKSRAKKSNSGLKGACLPYDHFKKPKPRI